MQSLGKKTLILNLRNVNHFIWKQKFKCEDWRALLSYVNKGDFFFSFDLKSGFHHFGLFPDHQTFGRGEERFREEGETTKKDRKEGERKQKNRETGEPA